MKRRSIGTSSRNIENKSIFRPDTMTGREGNLMKLNWDPSPWKSMCISSWNC